MLDEAESIELLGIGIVLRVSHLYLLRDDYPIVGWNMSVVRKRKWCGDLPRHANCRVRSQSIVPGEANLALCLVESRTDSDWVKSCCFLEEAI